MGRRKTHEEFQAQVKELGESKYELISTYENSRTKVEMKHLVCGHTYNVRPSKFTEGKRCPNCSKPFQNKKTHEEFKAQVVELGESKYELLSTYENSQTKVNMRHLVCGHVYNVRPDKFLEGKRCPNCSKTFGKKKTHEEFEAQVLEVGESEYELISTYTNGQNKVNMKHLVCGHKYNVIPSKFLEGRRCPNCFGAKTKKHDVFLKEVKELEGEDYAVMSAYINNKTHIQMKHMTCSHEYKVTPGKFLRGGRCPYCRSSKGEMLVEKMLKELKLPFEKEVKFPECKNINPLPFDFAIKDDTGQVIMLIEYDGRQHFEPNQYFGGREKFVRQVRNDRIKSNYAKTRGIPLFRLFYNQPNQETLLKHVLKQFLLLHARLNQQEAS